MPSHREKMAALRKAEANGDLTSNEQFALEELAHEHTSEGRRAQKVIGQSGGNNWGILGRS